MNLLEYKRLSEEIENNPVKAKALTEILDSNKELIINDISAATGKSNGWIKLTDGSIFYFDIKAPELEYFNRFDLTGLNTINLGNIEMLKVNNKILRHHQNMIKHIYAMGKPKLRHPNYGEIIYNKTIHISIDRPELDPSFVGAHTGTEIELSKYKDFSILYKFVSLDEGDLYNAYIDIPESSMVYMRARFVSNNYKSEWSDTVVLRTGIFDYVDKPVIMFDNIKQVFASKPVTLRNELADVNEARWKISTDSSLDDKKTITIIKTDDLDNITLPQLAGVDRYIAVQYLSGVYKSSWSETYKLSYSGSYYITTPDIPTVVDITANQFSTSAFEATVNNTSTYLGTEWLVSTSLNDEGDLDNYTSFISSSESTVIPVIKPNTINYIKCRHFDSSKTPSEFSDLVAVFAEDPISTLDINTNITMVGGDFIKNGYINVYIDKEAVVSYVTIEVVIKNRLNSILDIKSITIDKNSINDEVLSLPIFDNNLKINETYVLNIRYIQDDVSSRIKTYRGVLKDNYYQPINIAPKPKFPSSPMQAAIKGSRDVVINIGGPLSGYGGFNNNGIWLYNTSNDTWEFRITTIYDHISNNLHAYNNVASGDIYIIDPYEHKSEVVNLFTNERNNIVFNTLPSESSTIIAGGYIFSYNSDDIYYLDGGTLNSTQLRKIWKYETNVWVHVDTLPHVTDMVVYNDGLLYYTTIIDSEVKIFNYNPISDKDNDSNELSNSGLSNKMGTVLKNDSSLYYIFNQTHSVTYLAKYNNLKNRWEIKTKLPTYDNITSYSSVIMDDKLLLITRIGYTNGISLDIE